MHSIKEVLVQIDGLRGDIQALRNLLVKNAPPIPFTSQQLLRLHLSQIKAFIALDSLGNQGLHSASEVAQFLGVKRAMVSKALNELQRMGIVEKTRHHKTVVFKVAKP